MKKPVLLCLAFALCATSAFADVVISTGTTGTAVYGIGPNSVYAEDLSVVNDDTVVSSVTVHPVVNTAGFAGDISFWLIFYRFNSDVHNGPPDPVLITDAITVPHVDGATTITFDVHSDFRDPAGFAVALVSNAPNQGFLEVDHNTYPQGELHYALIDPNTGWLVDHTDADGNLVRWDNFDNDEMAMDVDLTVGNSPEPATLALFGSGIAAIAGMKLKR